ncbi:kinase-like domain-containing protein, partial [Rhizophagus diaphanus]
KLQKVCSIVKGLKEIHDNQMVHHDFHTGNILFNDPSIETFIYISDMGLCRQVGNVDTTDIYGVMPYLSPEVLKGNPYTQAADIYSFGMIMYFVATGRQPFDNCAHDHNLALDICKGDRPGINELEAPKCYIDLMERCWNANPNNRPNITEL